MNFLKNENNLRVFLLWVMALILLWLFTSCDKEEVCECIKYTQNTYDPEPSENPEFLLKEVVECQEEVLFAKDDLGRIYFIDCN